MAKPVKVTLRRGRYFAGVDVPFFVPNSLIVEGVRELGGENVAITDRADAVLPFDPAKVDPKYSDAWEEVVTADYDGPTKTIEEPRRWKWLVVVPSSSAPSSSTPGSTANTPGVSDIVAGAAKPRPLERSSSGAGVAVVVGAAAAAGVGLLLWKRRRGRR